MDFQELAAKRYSARDFSQMPIPKEVIDQILMAGNAAPTAHNNQPQDKHSGEIDASIVATHMMLEAADLGIGSTWIMYFIPEAVRVEFELPDNVEPVAVLIMGYTDAEPSKEHFHRRDLEEYVIYR